MDLASREYVVSLVVPETSGRYKALSKSSVCARSEEVNSCNRLRGGRDDEGGIGALWVISMGIDETKIDENSNMWGIDVEKNIYSEQMASMNLDVSLLKVNEIEMRVVRNFSGVLRIHDRKILR